MITSSALPAAARPWVPEWVVWMIVWPRSSRRSSSVGELPASNPGSGREHGDYPGHVMQSSLYTRAALNPGIALIVLSMLGLTTALAARYRSASSGASTGWDL